MENEKQKKQAEPQAMPAHGIDQKKESRLPPAYDSELLRMGASVCSNLVGFPCEVIFREIPGTDKLCYLMRPELDLVTKNMRVYSTLKEFNIMYLQVNEQVTGPGKLRMFDNMVHAIFHFGQIWQAFTITNRQQCTEVVSICRSALGAAADEIAREQEQLMKRKN